MPGDREQDLKRIREMVSWANKRLAKIFADRLAEEQAFDAAWDQRAKEVAELEKLFKLGD